MFLTNDVEVVGSGRIVGKDHLRFKVRQDGIVLDAIGFNLGRFLSQVTIGRKDLQLVYSVEESEWNGETFPQLKVKDLKYGPRAQ